MPDPSSSLSRTPAGPKRILVVGGGLAGIAAATALHERGGEQLQVTLLESRHALGGRASSFDDPENPGMQLDNCQHVLLGCCTNLLDLYERLGVRDKITFHKTVHFLDAHGGRHDLRGIAGWPAPLHLGPSLALFSLLTLRERLAVIRGQLAMLRLGKTGRDRLDGVVFGDWLDQHRQPPSLIKKFYDPILISALNEETRRVSAKYAIQVFQDAMLAHAAGYLVGLPNCHLGELYANLPGGDVRLNARVDEIIFNSEFRIQNSELPGATGVKLRDGEILTADALILATNHHAVQRWIPDDLKQLDCRFPQLPLLQAVPILGVHLFFDRPVMQIPAAALVDGPLQWIFRKDAEGKVIHGVISAARAWSNIPRHEALPLFEAQIRALFPHAKDAVLERGVIVIEKRATFAPLPDTDLLRPSQAPPLDGGGIRNLFLAGDYTQTGWPATMEGAVRSGYLAAEALLDSLGTPTPILKPDLPTQWPARMLGLK